MTSARPTLGQRLAFGFLVGVLVALPFVIAYGQTHQGHAEFHDVYKDWVQPARPSMSCCSAKYDHHGNTLRDGDCYATVAEPRPSAEHPDGPIVWWARRDNGEWIEINRRYIVNELNPDETGTRAHLCENFSIGGGVLCFLPPSGGS